VNLETIRALLSEIAQAPVQRLVSLDDVVDELQRAGMGCKTPCHFSVGGSAKTETLLLSEVASSLLAIGQESLQNAELHSGATRIDVAFAIDTERVTLSVTDNGRGLQGVGRPKKSEAGHLGLRRMRAAALNVGGQLNLSPVEGGGLSVEAKLPLQN
jgi:signal transduction histidine kinase